MAASTPSPPQIAALLERRVIGQKDAIREISVGLAKKLAKLRVGNILMIGSSGSGKTTLMRAVEAVLAQNPALALRSTVIRIHANVLGEEAERGHPGEALLLPPAGAGAAAARPRDARWSAWWTRRATASCSWTRWTRSEATWAAR